MPTLCLYCCFNSLFSSPISCLELRIHLIWAVVVFVSLKHLLSCLSGDFARFANPQHVSLQMPKSPPKKRANVAGLAAPAAPRPRLSHVRLSARLPRPVSSPEASLPFRSHAFTHSLTQKRAADRATLSLRRRRMSALTLKNEAPTVAAPAKREGRKTSLIIPRLALCL